MVLDTLSIGSKTVVGFKSGEVLGKARRSKVSVSEIKSNVLPNINPVKQDEKANCVIASLAVVLNYYGDPVTQDDLGLWFYNPSEYKGAGTTFDRAVTVAKANGLEAKEFRPNLDLIKEDLLVHESPVILDVMDSDGPHAVVLVGITEDTAYFVDPWPGKILKTSLQGLNSLIREGGYEGVAFRKRGINL